MRTSVSGCWGPICLALLGRNRIWHRVNNFTTHGTHRSHERRTVAISRYDAPVEPKPPLPRPVVASDFARFKVTTNIGAITSCAILSPRLIVTDSLLRLMRRTLI